MESESLTRAAVESKLSTTMIRILITCLVALSFQSGASAWTIESRTADAESGTSMHATQGGISLAQATQVALQQNPGRVVRAETVDRGGRREHHIRILGGDGRVRTVRVDASSGRVL
ncbi:MAG: PepSY domain-containing protein [Gammaproteobacteria bacterium]|nr:PepSY domain-containing protein [Gammaproteobacteria bacterium]